MEKHSKSASPSEPRPESKYSVEELKRCTCGHKGLPEKHWHLSHCVLKLGPAEPRRDEREAFLKQADIDWRYESAIVKREFGTKLMALAESAWDAASRASATLPQTANEILQTLKFAKEVIDNQVSRFHKGCRCQLCESLPESLQRAIELLESSKIAAVPQPSAGHMEDANEG